MPLPAPAPAVQTTHDVVVGNARELDTLDDASVELVVTLPPDSEMQMERSDVFFSTRWSIRLLASRSGLGEVGPERGLAARSRTFELDTALNLRMRDDVPVVGSFHVFHDVE